MCFLLWRITLRQGHSGNSLDLDFYLNLRQIAHWLKHVSPLNMPDFFNEDRGIFCLRSQEKWSISTMCPGPEPNQNLMGFCCFPFPMLPPSGGCLWLCIQQFSCKLTRQTNQHADRGKNFISKVILSIWINKYTSYNISARTPQEFLTRGSLCWILNSAIATKQIFTAYVYF